MENNNKNNIKDGVKTPIQDNSNNPSTINDSSQKIAHTFPYTTSIEATNFTWKAGLPEFKPTEITINGNFKPVVGPLFKLDVKPFNKESDIVAVPNEEIPIKDEFEKYRLTKKIEKTDDALLNAVLAYSVYEEKEWILDYINKPISDEIKDKLTQCIINSSSDSAITEKNIERLFDLKLLTFCKDFFSPMTSDMLKEYSNNDLILLDENNEGVKFHGYDLNDLISQSMLGENQKPKSSAGIYKDGFFTNSNDFAHAHVLTSNHPKGGKVLHISFRGTEFNRGFAYLLGKYVPQAYLDMSAYYDRNFKALEEALINYARDPKNNITEIQVTGHSLGGSMVQEFLKNNPKLSQEQKDKNSEINHPEILGYTFGSPGSQKTKIMSFLTLVGHSALALIDGVQTVATLGQLNKTEKLLRHVNQIRNSNLFSNNPYKNDSRLVEYYHTTDPIPALGALGYKHNGETIQLYDRMNADDIALKLKNKAKTSKVGKFLNLVADKVPVVRSLKDFAITFHGIRRYVINLKDIIEDAYKNHPDLTSNFDAVTQYTQEFKLADKKFIQTLEQNKDEVAYAIKSSFYSKEQLSNRYNQANNQTDKQKVIDEILKQGFDLDEVLSEMKSPDYSNKFNADTVINKIADMSRFDTFASFILEQQKAQEKKRHKATQSTPFASVVGTTVAVASNEAFGFTLKPQHYIKASQGYSSFISSSDQSSLFINNPLLPINTLSSKDFAINLHAAPIHYNNKKNKDTTINSTPITINDIHFTPPKDIAITFAKENEKTHLTLNEVLNPNNQPLNLSSGKVKDTVIDIADASTSKDLSINDYHIPSIAEKRRKIGIVGSVEEKIKDVKGKFKT